MKTLDNQIQIGKRKRRENGIFFLKPRQRKLNMKKKKPHHQKKEEFKIPKQTNFIFKLMFKTSKMLSKIIECYSVQSSHYTSGPGPNKGYCLPKFPMLTTQKREKKKYRTTPMKQWQTTQMKKKKIKVLKNHNIILNSWPMLQKSKQL